MVVVRVGEDDLRHLVRGDPGRPQGGHRVHEHGAAAGGAPAGEKPVSMTTVRAGLRATQKK